MRGGVPKIAALLALALAGSLAACTPNTAGESKGAPVPSSGGKVAARRVLAEGLCEKLGIKVQVIEVERTAPEAVSVKFVLVNPDTAAAVSVGDIFSEPDAFRVNPADAASGSGSPGSLAGIYLLDETRQKKFFVMRDDQDRPLCTTDLGQIPPGGRVEAWARFPAPAQGTSRITVQLPGVPALRDLPISDPAGTAKPGLS